MAAHLDDNPWFHGDITREEAEHRLWATGPACGCFLVRISQSLSQRLCLSVWSDGKYFHIIVPVNRAGHFYLESPSSGFASLQELIFLYNETRKPFTSTCGEELQLCIACPRPVPTRHDEGAVYPDYCNSFIIGGSVEAPTDAKCPDELKHSLRSTTSSASGMRVRAAQTSTPSGTQPVADFKCTSSRQQNATRPQVGSCPSHCAAPAPSHCRQRHNAGDGLPIMLSKDPADKPSPLEQERPRRPSFARKMAEAVARWTYCLIMCGVQPDWARDDGSEVHTLQRRAGKKRKRSSSSVLAEEHTVDNSEKKNIRVRGVSDQFLAEQISKPIVYANDMAKFKMVQSNAHLIDQTCALRAPIPVMS